MVNQSRKSIAGWYGAPAHGANPSFRAPQDGCGNYEVAVPVAGGWAVLEVVMNVPGDLAACVHPRFVRTDSGHRLTDRPL
jgi:hypothetical protein